MLVMEGGGSCVQKCQPWGEFPPQEIFAALLKLSSLTMSHRHAQLRQQRHNSPDYGCRRESFTLAQCAHTSGLGLQVSYAVLSHGTLELSEPAQIVSCRCCAVMAQLLCEFIERLGS